ncbi:MAG: RES family NAD+ phosphorylase [Rhodococcus sp.]|nr:RES family NAD+ phosphorylase [Rhodococcus sp. (in: high G+C Gram-positive bacteria)]
MPSTLPPPRGVDALRDAGITDDEYFTVDVDALTWRVHRTVGEHVVAWNRLRTYGPLLRFDPHPRPVRDHPHYGVWYGAGDIPGALAEVFQTSRTIDRTAGAPYVTGLHFTRPLALLDIGGFGVGRWPTRVGGNFALATAPHSVTQQWARTIRAAYPNLDGIVYRGRFSGAQCVALLPPTADAFPETPALSLPLDHPGLISRLAEAAGRLGYSLV